jgi:hypothetical protein
MLPPPPPPPPPPPEPETEKRLFPVDPNPVVPIDPELELRLPDVAVELLWLVVDRSLYRLVLPRIAPRLDAPVPMAAFAAELVETVCEGSVVPPEEVEEDVPLVLLEDIDELDEDEDEPEPLDPPEPDIVDPPPPPPRRLEPPVPRPVRLPRSCGAIRAAKRSALIVPDKRTERETLPVLIVTVGVVFVVPPPPPCRKVSLARKYPVPATSARDVRTPHSA